eukprot:1158697-Pelagomonas_calceolata.AAC.13
MPCNNKGCQKRAIHHALQLQGVPEACHTPCLAITKANEAVVMKRVLDTKLRCDKHEQGIPRKGIPRNRCNQGMTTRRLRVAGCGLDPLPCMADTKLLQNACTIRSQTLYKTDLEVAKGCRHGQHSLPHIACAGLIQQLLHTGTVIGQQRVQQSIEVGTTCSAEHHVQQVCMVEEKHAQRHVDKWMH